MRFGRSGGYFSGEGLDGYALDADPYMLFKVPAATGSFGAASAWLRFQPRPTPQKVL